MARIEIDRTRDTRVQASAVWERCYADPAAWPEWNQEIAAVKASGPIQRGSRVKVRFRTGLRLEFHITELEPERVFTDEARLPGARLGHRHVLEPTATGVRLRNTIYFEGPLAGVWARLGGKRAAAALEEGQRRAAALAATS
jgi:hypothetical protein